MKCDKIYSQLLQDYIRCNPGNRPGYFPCPMCRKSTMVPHDGVAGFPDNFMLTSLADTIQEESWEPPHGDQHQVSPSRNLYPPSPREQRHRAHE